ncbi:unnamed protein product [Litomosoides sigmodontis]|uniref:Uncharacterized protein n=1 Tax=Litomosoides sigmodontis TaxID=42156 RepID=A0A3P7M9C9_LITSI|nr:unnamed protein product [Litomosoides sigmodontis]
MQIPTKASDVDQFLDAIFEQVLPANDLERTDDNYVNAEMITSTINGTIANDANETLQSASQQCLAATVNYAPQPMMVMVPVDASGAITAAPLSSVIPIMVPMMCMSPTPCLSPISAKNAMATSGSVLHTDDRALSSTSVCYNYNTTSSTYSNGTMTSNNYANGTNYSERSSPPLELAQPSVNLVEKSRVGQIQPTSTKARYVGPVHPQTNECLKSPPLATKNLHDKQKDENNLQLHHQLGYFPPKQFNATETDSYSGLVREKSYSGRSVVLSRRNDTSSPSYSSLRRTQPHFRQSLSPSPSPRLVPIPETEFSAAIIDGQEIIPNNSFPKIVTVVFLFCLV